VSKSGGSDGKGLHDVVKTFCVSSPVAGRCERLLYVAPFFTTTLAQACIYHILEAHVLEVVAGS
jgi:hypothetical protein